MALQKYLTEFVGTFFLVLTIGFATTPGGAGNLAPLAIGAVLLAIVYMGGHVSGAHYNPAVSLAVLVRGKMSVKDFVPYIIAQLAGAVVAALAVRFIRGVPFQVHIAKEAGMLHPLTVEFIFTFALALVVVNVATTPKNAGNSFYGLAIGMIVTAGAWAVGSVSGGAFNPAVGTGPNLVAAMLGEASSKPEPAAKVAEPEGTPISFADFLKKADEKKIESLTVEGPILFGRFKDPNEVVALKTGSTKTGKFQTQAPADTTDSWQFAEWLSKHSITATNLGPQVSAPDEERSPLRDVWIYWVAPLAGGLLAGLFCNFQVCESKNRSA